MKSFEIKADKKYIAFPVWNAPKWDRYSLVIKDKSGTLLYTFKLPEENGNAKPDYHAFLPVTDVDSTLLIETDAPYPVEENIYTSDDILQTSETEECLHYHAPYGSINDPNGLIYTNGTWHMYHQHNPMDNVWGNMSWGHAVSKDLVHFTFVGDELFPDRDGVMFSGCAIKNDRSLLSLPKDAILYYYTLACDRKDKQTDESVPFFTQRLAYSTDNGYDLKKYTDFELENLAPDNRDPKIFWHEESESYIMSLFLTKNRFVLLRSSDLKKWEKASEYDFPPMWECPDLLRLPDGKWAFMSADGYYYIGSFDGYSFKKETEMLSLYEGGLPYAAQSFSCDNGRLISTAWMRTENRGENWHGMMGVAREFETDYANGTPYIRQRFVPEANPYIKNVSGSAVIEDKYLRETISPDGRTLNVEQLW